MQIVRTIEIQLTLVTQRRQCGVDLCLRAGECQRAAIVGACADGSATRQAQVQHAVAHGQLRGSQITVYVVNADGVGAGEIQCRIFIHRLCARHAIDGGVVHRAHCHGQRYAIGIDQCATGAGIAKVIADHLQAVRAIEVQITLILQRGQGGVNIRQRPANGERATVVGARAYGCAAGERHIQRPLRYGQLRGHARSTAIHIADADAVGAAKRQHGVFVYRLRTWRGVHWCVIHGVHGDGDAVTIDKRPANTGIAKIVG